MKAGILTGDETVTRRWQKIAIGAAVVGSALCGYQFIYVPFSMPPVSAERLAFDQYGLLFFFYWVANSAALFSGPQAVTSVLNGQPVQRFFAGACVATACSGVAMNSVVGDAGAGGDLIKFYWISLCVLWIAVVMMIYLCNYLARPQAVKDWVIVAYGLALLPVTLVPSLWIWPFIVEMNTADVWLTASTLSFAAHFLIGQYIIVEKIDGRRRRRTSR